eukprot:s1082_g14.t1
MTPFASPPTPAVEDSKERTIPEGSDAVAEASDAYEGVATEELPFSAGRNVLFEYACSDDSIIGQKAEQCGLTCIRLSRSVLDLEKPEDVEQALGQLRTLPGSDAWNRNWTWMVSGEVVELLRIHGKEYSKKLRKARKRTMKMLDLAIPFLEQVIENNGRIGVEWPRSNGLWETQAWIDFMTKHNLKYVHFDGCALGLKGRHQKFLKKPWCGHEIVAVLWSEWMNDEKGLKAVQDEADGLRRNNTWDDASVTTLANLRHQSKSSGNSVKVAALHVLCGIKHFEQPYDAWKYKGRIVYRGDQIRNESNELVLYADTATTPTALVALNLALFYGSCEHNAVSLSDAIQAFLQAPIEEETWIIMPYELWLDEWKKKYSSDTKLVVRLLRSLYGHPLAGKLWQEFLSGKLRQLGGESSGEWYLMCLMCLAKHQKVKAYKA